MSFLFAIAVWAYWGDLVWAIFAFFVTFAIHVIVFNSVETCVTTIFVGCAETPEAAAISAPELYDHLQAAKKVQECVPPSPGGTRHLTKGTERETPFSWWKENVDLRWRTGPCLVMCFV